MEDRANKLKTRSSARTAEVSKPEKMCAEDRKQMDDYRSDIEPVQKVRDTTPNRELR